MTGAGPHAGDENAPRNGLVGSTVTHLHAGAVYLAVAATVVCVLLLRSRAAWSLLAIEAAQAGIGVTQYHLGLPIGLVVLHLLGACLAVAAATNLMLSVRPADVSAAPPARAARPRPAGR